MQPAMNKHPDQWRIQNYKERNWILRTPNLNTSFHYSLGPFAKWLKATISFIISVCPSTWNSAPTGGIFIKSYIWALFRNSGDKIHVSLKSDKNKGYFTRRLIYIFIISRSVLVRMKNVSDKILGNIKALILCSITFIRKSCHFLHNWGKIVQSRADNRGHYGANTWHAGYLRPQTHTHVM
jgi:hypothetical protein